MGIFSSKKVTTVNTFVSRVMDDNGIPDAVKSGVMKGILRDESLNENILEELVGSIAVRAERMYTYAEKHYTHGSPSGDVYSDTRGRDEMQTVLNQLEGSPVFMAYSHFGPINNLHVGWMQLASDYGYDASSNQLAVLSAQKGVPVYLNDMVMVLPPVVAAGYAPNAFEQWDTPPNAGYTPERLASSVLTSALVQASVPVIDASLSEAKLRVSFVWKTGAVINEASLLLSLGEYDDDPDADYYQAKYTVNGQTKYWAYRYGAGQYPELDKVFSSEFEASGSYFPFTHFRYNKQSTNADKTSDAYKTSKKMVKFLGMDFDAMADAINTNPDIADVQQAMLTMAVPAVTSNAVEAKYLFKYFENLYFVSSNRTGLSGVSGVSGLFARLFDRAAANTIVIQDRQFKMALSHNGIARRRRVGVVAPVGTCTAAYVSEVVEIPVDDSTGLLEAFPDWSAPKHTYRFQVSKTLYDEITVSGLRMVYYVLGNYTTVGDEQDAILLIPIDRAISSDMQITEREELYSRSLHIVFNSVIITKVKWYQTGIFRVVMFIVAVAMAFVDGGATLAAYLSITTTQAIILMIVISQVIAPIVLPALFKLFVKVFGQDIATLIAIAAIIYGGYEFITSPGMAGAPFAQVMLEVATGLQGAIMQDKFLDLAEAQTDYFEFMKEQTKTLDAANKLLETTSFLSPFVIFGETPNDFYNRTVHSGNVGVLSISAISSYVDIALTLPKLDETLETIGEKS